MGLQFDGINNEIKSQTKIDFPGSIGIAGTLTYEDVTNVDSIGIITARAGIDVTGGTITGDGSGLTGISGFSTALSNTQGTLENLLFKTTAVSKSNLIARKVFVYSIFYLFFLFLFILLDNLFELNEIMTFF